MRGAVARRLSKFRSRRGQARQHSGGQRRAACI